MKNLMKHYKRLLAALALAVLCQLGASAQSVRGDWDYDGDMDMSDLTQLINYVLNERWNDVPDVERDTFMVGKVPIVMVHVQGGSYSLGGGITVTVNDFSICETEVTKDLWWTVMHDTTYPYGATKRPVTFVAQDDSQAFIDALNGLTGANFRFPRSTEWQFAARGGNRSLGYSFAGGNILELVGWYKGNSTEAHDVAYLKPNELGLYDMSGNVSEWCVDATNGSLVSLGGSWLDDAAACLIISPGTSLAGTLAAGAKQKGFRLAM